MLTRQTLTPDGLAALQGKRCTIELRADGTFTATNVPPWKHWGVYLESDAVDLDPPGLTGRKPPYGLIYTLGDPDSGDAMIFERTSS